MESSLLSLLSLDLSASAQLHCRSSAPQPRRSSSKQQGCSVSLKSESHLPALLRHVAACRVAKVAGLSAASLALAVSANAATVKLGADGGGLVFDPSSITIKAGETVEWVNNVGFPHNVVFDEDEVPVSAQGG